MVEIGCALALANVSYSQSSGPVYQWFNINPMHCNLPYIPVLLMTHFFIEKCDKSELLTRPGCMEDCNAMHLHWTIQCIYIGQWSAAP